MSEPQPAALFPLWDLLSYFFRLWFGERNQHINDFFFPQKPLNNSWHVFMSLLAAWFGSSCGEEDSTTQSVEFWELLVACLFLACTLGVCCTCWASCARFYPVPGAAA